MSTAGFAGPLARHTARTGKRPLPGRKRTRDHAAPAQQGLVDRGDQRAADAGGDQAQDRLGRARRDQPSGRGAAPGQRAALQLVMDRARVVGHERLARQLAQPDARAARELAARGQDQERAQSRDRTARQPGGERAREVGDGQVDFAAAHDLRIGRRQLAHLDAQIGLAALQPADPARQHLLQDQSLGGQAQLARRRRGLERALDGRQLFEERRRMIVELPPRGGEPDLGLAHALEQADAQLVFELAHLLEHRGLGQRVGERARRRGIAAGARDPVEAFQAGDLHR